MGFEGQENVEQQQEIPDTSTECLNTLQQGLDSDNDDAFFDASVKCLSEVNINELKPTEGKTRRILPGETESGLKFANSGEKKEVGELEQAANDAQDALDAAEEKFRIAERNKLNPEGHILYRPSKDDLKRPDTQEMIDARAEIELAKQNLKKSQDKYWNSSEYNKGENSQDKNNNESENNDSNEFANIEPKELFENNRTLFDKALITLNYHADSHEGNTIKGIIEQYVKNAGLELKDGWDLKVEDGNMVIDAKFAPGGNGQDLILGFGA